MNLNHDSSSIKREDEQRRFYTPKTVNGFLLPCCPHSFVEASGSPKPHRHTTHSYRRPSFRVLYCLKSEDTIQSCKDLNNTRATRKIHKANHRYSFSSLSTASFDYIYWTWWKATKAQACIRNQSGVQLLSLGQNSEQVEATTMADDGIVALYNKIVITDATMKNPNPFSIKVGMAQMLGGGAVFEVTTVEQAKIAEEAGACAIDVLELPPVQGAVARMADPSLIKEIKRAISIPVIAKARVGHFVEAQVLETTGVDYIDESEVLTPADEDHHINKHSFRVPFVCGCRGLGTALMRVREGAALIRIEGGVSGSGNIAETVRNVRSVMGDMRVLTNMDDDEVFSFAKKISAPNDLVAQTKQLGRLPVMHFAAGGIVTPADAALMMQLGCDGVFMGCEIFNSPDPYRRACAIVQAVRHYNDPDVLVEASCVLMTDAMAGLNLRENRVEQYGTGGIY